MKRNARFLRIFMCMVLGASVSFTSCKDYDDDIEALDERVSTIEKDLKKLSEDFGALAYVKSVSFANGVLTVTPSVGNPLTYEIPDNDTNTTYSLETSVVDGKVVVTLTGNDGSTSKGEFDMPSSFDGSLLTVDAEGNILYNGERTGATIPSVAEFDESKLTIGEDNCIYYDGKKTGAQLDVFNPANLTTDAEGNILYNGVKTGVVLPKVPATPELTIVEVKDSMGAVIGYSITYGGKTSNLKIESGKLQSLVFVPEFYYQGIEAQGVWTFEYNALALGKLDVNGDDSKDAPKVGEKTSVSPELSVRYHMNPSNVSVDLLPLKNLSFIFDNKAYTRSSDVVEVEILDRTVANGILTVKANLSNGLIKDINKDQEVTVFALQAGTRGEKGDTLVTSDYAALKAMRATDFKLADVRSTEVSDKHLYETAAAAIAAEPQFDIVWNDEDGIDVAELVQTHYNYENNGNKAHGTLDQSAATGESKAYGFKYKYELVGWMDGVNKTSQSAHAAMKGSVLRAQMTAGGVQQEFGYEQGRATIGRMPIVRVILEDTISHNNVAVGYVKFEIVDEDPVTPEDTYKEVSYEISDEDYVVSCTNDYGFKLSWAQVEEKLYTAVNMSKEEFEDNYDLDGYYGSPVYATQFDKVGLDAVEVEKPFGNVSITRADWEGTMTEVLLWAVNANEAYEYFTNPENIQKTVIVRFKRGLISDAKDKYVYVKLNWAPKNIYAKPMGTVDNDSKITNYWYALASANAGLDEVHAHVAVPEGSWTADEKCIYVKDLLDYFKGGKIGVAGIEPVYEEFAQDMTFTLKFVKPRVTETTGISGAKYTLAASADGRSLKATNVATKATADVVILNGTEVEYQENAIAKDLLNNAGRLELADGETLAAKVGISAANGCDKPIELDNNTFEVRFIRPISVLSEENDGLTDGLDNGDEIALDEFIGFEDWRGEEFTLTNKYFNYYGVKAVTIDTDNITTDLSGSDITKDKLTTVAPKIRVEFVPTTGTLALNNMGKLTYKNNGGELREAFKIRVPVKVAYKWGEVIVKMDITVNKTVGK